MAKLKIVYWHDIPAQVVMRIGRRNERFRLSYKFADAIDRASNRLKKRGEDALFDPWQTVEQAFQGNIQEQAQLLVKQLEENYNDEVLDRLIRASGVDEMRLKTA
ncbi:MAG: hypothetical protein GY744_14805 [Gammaproteobacteria bacterium]|nr:hypothetical protein [Gammaproteobacteria bacterium]